MRRLIATVVLVALLGVIGISPAQGKRGAGGIARITGLNYEAEGVDARAYSYTRSPARESGVAGPSIDPTGAVGNPAPVSLVEDIPEATRFAPDPCDLVTYAENWNGYDISSDYAFGTTCAPAPDENNRNPRRPRGPDLSALIASAIDRATSLAPEPELGIAPSRIGLTGLETFVWAADPLAPITATASAGGITVTAEASVTEYRFDFGDGYETISYGPGRPWTEAHDGTVGHTYEIKGYYDITVNAIWTGRWRIGSGPWQPLGYFSTSNSRSYPVQEIVTRLVETH
jgi:hypothetical protein